ncbi:MAG: hypothetical protein NC400_04880, partial [Clostridium sp.]|nr:hypothetical protein [Clostridium sp.]
IFPTVNDKEYRVLEQAGIEHLDRNAVALAREKYKEKMNQKHISEEVDAMSDEQFLTKLKLMINGKITYARMLLLGNSDYDYMFQFAPSIVWRLYGTDNMDRDYAIFKIPFINVVVCKIKKKDIDRPLICADFDTSLFIVLNQMGAPDEIFKTQKYIGKRYKEAI